jgi:hypothetical protein
MPESFIPLSAGSGTKNARTFSQSISATTVEEQAWWLAEHPVNTVEYTCPAITPVTAGLHVLEIITGAGDNFVWWPKWIGIFQLAAATAAAIDDYQLVWIRNAALGTQLTGAPYDTGDSLTMSPIVQVPPWTAVPAHSYETQVVARFTCQFTQTVATQSGGPKAALIGELDCDRLRSKLLRLPRSANAGLAVKAVTGRAGASVIISARLAGAG